MASWLAICPVFYLGNLYRKTSMLSRQDSADCAHLRSHAGPNAGAAFGYAPTAREFEIRPTYFRTLVLERLRLPLPLVEATCEGCDAVLDPMGFTPSRVPSQWPLASTGYADRVGASEGLPQGGGARSLQRVLARHEHQCRCPRRPPD